MEKPVKVFYLITSSNVGGTEKALFELIRRIDRAVFSVSVCSIKKPGCFAKKLAAASDRFYSLGLSEAGGGRAAVNFLPALFTLVRIVHAAKPTILHCFLFRANIMGRIAARLAGVPVVICSIRVIEERKWLKHLIDRRTSGMVDRYLAVSEAVRQFTLRQLRLPPEKIITIPNGIDCPAIALRAPQNLPERGGTFKILCAGRYERQKGHSFFIEALNRMVQQGVPVQAYLFGEGPDEKKIKDLVKRTGLAEQIQFMGITDDLLSWLQRVDVCVLPSLWEGQPNVLLEAMAACCPVVATRIPGIDELIKDGTTGLLCAPADPESLATALLQVFHDPAGAAERAHAARQWVEQFFSLEATVRATVSVYEQVLQQKSLTRMV